MARQSAVVFTQSASILPERLAAWSHAPPACWWWTADATAEALRQTPVSVERQDYAAAGVWLRGEPPALESSPAVAPVARDLDWAQLDAHLTRVGGCRLAAPAAGWRRTGRAGVAAAGRADCYHSGAGLLLCRRRPTRRRRAVRPVLRRTSTSTSCAAIHTVVVLAFARGGLLAAGGFRGRWAN